MWSYHCTSKCKGIFSFVARVEVSLKSIKKIEITARRERFSEPDVAYEVVVNNPPTLASLFRQIIRNRDREILLVLLLNSYNKVIGYSEAGVGSIDGCACAPREIFRAAIIIGAVAIVICHNHPAGNPKPSTEDHLLTNKMSKAGELLGIPLLDHLIVGEGESFYSFAQEGTLKQERNVGETNE